MTQMHCITISLLSLELVSGSYHFGGPKQGHRFLPWQQLRCQRVVTAQAQIKQGMS